MATFAEENFVDFSNAQVSIKYYNRTVYYPGTADEAPVFVHITIKNNGSETLRFKLADDRSFSMDFNAYTVKNSRLEQTENIIEKRFFWQKMRMTEGLTFIMLNDILQLVTCL